MQSVIFDFDGTLANSMPLFKSLLAEWQEQGFFSNFSEEEIDAWRDKCSREILAELGIPFWKVPSLVIQGRRIIKERLGDVNCFPDIPEIVQKLHAEGLQLHIVSSNSKENIIAVLTKAGLTSCFHEIISSPGIFGKATSLRSLMRKRSLRPEHCLYVGDEARDMEAAHSLGIKGCAVTWGFNTRRKLQATEPQFIIDTPWQLIKEVTATRTALAIS